MPGFGFYALAGAGVGLGQGLIEQANQARENALLQMKRQWELEDRAQDRAWKLEDRKQSSSGGGSGSGSTYLTGEEWIPGDDGVLTMYGRTRDGRMIPYTDKDGNPITKKGEKPPVTLSEGAKYRVAQSVINTSGEQDEAATGVVLEEIERLMREEGMTESEAEQSALSRMGKDTDVIPGRRGLFGIGATDDVEINRGFDGTFSPLDRGTAKPNATPPETPTPLDMRGNVDDVPVTDTGTDPVRSALSNTGRPLDRGIETPNATPPERETAVSRGFGSAPTTSTEQTTPAMPAEPGVVQSTMTPQQQEAAIMAARDAIQKGADPSAVAQRLVDNGINPDLINDRPMTQSERNATIRDAKAALAAGADRQAIERALALLGIDPREVGL